MKKRYISMTINLNKIQTKISVPIKIAITNNQKNSHSLNCPRKFCEEQAEGCASGLNYKQTDVVEILDSKNIVDVFHSLMKPVGNYEKIISPKFNGCHGVGIYSDNKIFFAHFPPFMKNRMKAAITSALKNFDANKNAQVVFISPVLKNGSIDSVFKEYKDLILTKFQNNPNIEYLKYPYRSNGATYTYTGIIDNGILKNFINKVV